MIETRLQKSKNPAGAIFHSVGPFESSFSVFVILLHRECSRPLAVQSGTVKARVPAGSPLAKSENFRDGLSSNMKSVETDLTSINFANIFKSYALPKVYPVKKNYMPCWHTQPRFTIAALVCPAMA
jgi:hypothetical protein